MLSLLSNSDLYGAGVYWERCDYMGFQEKCSEYLPILTGKGFSLKLKGKVYATCVRSCLIHSGERRPVKVEHEVKSNQSEMSVIG